MLQKVYCFKTCLCCLKITSYTNVLSSPICHLSLSKGEKLELPKHTLKADRILRKTLLFPEIRTSLTLVQASLGKLLIEKVLADVDILPYIKTHCAHRLPWPSVIKKSNLYLRSSSFQTGRYSWNDIYHFQVL